MDGRDTVLKGCEVICIGTQKTDLIACPLTKKERLECRERCQYRAGIREGVRRAYENLKAQHYLISYDLDRCVDYLEKRYTKKEEK